jgi:hypothetical protein
MQFACGVGSGGQEKLPDRSRYRCNEAGLDEISLSAGGVVMEVQRRRGGLGVRL